MNRPDKILWLDDAGRVDMPREFASSFDDRDVRVSGVSGEQWATLEKGPDDPEYWGTWNDVCNRARITDGNDVVYRLWQDGDLWLIPDGMKYSEEAGDFVWPERETLG
jgi:hypothetical protein